MCLTSSEKAFWSWQCTFVLDLLFGRHSDQALITLASITYCTFRSHVKCITISITRHFDHYLIIVRSVRDLRFPFNFLVQIGLDCSNWYYDRCINLEKYLLSFHDRSFQVILSYSWSHFLVIAYPWALNLVIILSYYHDCIVLRL